MSLRRRVADRQHRWFSQVEQNGVVLSEPVLAEAAPAGFRNLEKQELAQFYKAREVWNLPRGMVQGDADAIWTDFVLEQLLRLGPSRWQQGAEIPRRFVAPLEQQRETLRPTRVLLDGDEAVLLFLRVPRSQGLDTPWNTGGSWKASPTTKLERLLRETGVEVGLVTNGEAWRLLVASPSETASWLTWTAQTWADSPSTLSAFMDLLGEARFFAGPKPGTILELVRTSRKRQADVADQLGTQVREALELFVRELDHIDASVEGALLRSYSDDEVFEAIASLMMRLVFLLKAEESALLPHGAVAYDRSYGVLHLLTRLERAHRLNPERLRGSSEAYAQMLGTFRLIHQGSPDPDINVTAYGGDLFDPDTYPLLEGRLRDGELPGAHRLCPLPVRDSVIREMLRRLKYARGENDAVQWVSYRTLEIEQLGHMYEGLLDLKLKRASRDSMLLLLTPTGKVPSPTLAASELVDGSLKELGGAIAKATGRAAADVVSALKRNEQADVDESKLPEGLPRELAAAGPYVRKVGVVRAGGLYVDHGNRRHDQGAVYTPTSITEPMVRRTLEPLVFIGKVGERRLRSPREILALRVCDPAMGSAAFLVQTVRFLAEHLADAWDEALASSSDVALTMPYGTPAENTPDELLMPEAREERVLWARRFVAERCVYGGDINPLAVEMAKLSIWLTTAAPDKPFTFLNHVLRPGNSVVGVDLAQLRSWSLTRDGSEHPLITRLLESTISAAAATRHSLARLTGRAGEAERRRILKKAEAATTRLGIAADLLVGPWLGPGDDTAAGTQANSGLMRVVGARSETDWNALKEQVHATLVTKPLHWPFEFPDVFIEGQGFDAIIGNPPYVRQGLISGLKRYLKMSFRTFRGLADLYVYFFELGLRLLKPGGRLSMIVTNKWMRSAYGEGLRSILGSEACVEEIIDFGHAKQIFVNIDVFPSIVTLRRPTPEQPCSTQTTVCTIPRKQLRLDDLYSQIEKESFQLPRQSLGATPWQFDPPEVQALMQKMRDRGLPLRKFAGSAPVVGIMTGFNEAFVVDEEVRRKLLEEDARCDSVLLPLTRGRDIKRWTPSDSGLWLLYIPWNFKMERFPAIARHLEQYRDKLSARSGVHKNQFPWFALRRFGPEYAEWFSRPKIIFKEIQYTSSFALDARGTCVNNKAYFIPSADPALLGILNSPLLWWYCWRHLVHGKDDVLMSATARIGELPIPSLSTEAAERLGAAVQAILVLQARVKDEWQDLAAFIREKWPTCSAQDVIVAVRARGEAALLVALKKASSVKFKPARGDLAQATVLVQSIIAKVEALNTESRAHEESISREVFEAYGFTHDDQELVWNTAPPRTPLTEGFTEELEDEPADE